MTTLAARREIHGADIRLAVLAVVAFAVCGGASRLSAVWLYPHDLRGTYVDSLSVAATVLPIAVLAGILDEGLPSVVLTRRRSLALERLGWALAFVAAGVGLAAGTAGAPAGHLVLVAVLLAGATVLGAATVGVGTAWVLPGVIVAVCSAPGLIPLRHNVVYSLTTDDVLGPVAAAVLVIGTAVYARRGAAPGRVSRAGDRGDES